MSLTQKEKLIAIIANGIAVYSIYQENGNAPKNSNLYDFVLKTIPENLRPGLTVDLIDEVFQFVSATHSS